MPLTYLDVFYNWIGVAGGALALATVLSGVVYMLGSMLMNDKMKTWAKMEVMEVIYSAIILSLALMAIPMIDAAVQGAFGISNAPGAGTAAISNSCNPVSSTSTYMAIMDQGNKRMVCMDICGPEIALDESSVYHGIPSCHMRMGIWFLRELFEETKLFAYDVYLEYMGWMLVQELTINIEFIFEMAGFFTFTPWKGFTTMGNNIRGMLFDWATKLMMLLKFQEVMLYIIGTGLFPALFVIGLILRSFLFTRRLGGLVLAMAIALYFILPAFYTFGAMIMLDVKNSVRSAGQAVDPPIANAMIYDADRELKFLTGTVTSGEAHREFDRLGGDSITRETETSKRFLQTFEQDPNREYTIQGDMSANPAQNPNLATEDQRKQVLTDAYNKVETWKRAVSSVSRWDNFVGFAWVENGPVDTLARLTFWSVFFAIFGLLSTIAAIRALSITFGGDIEIAGLTRLI